MDEIIEWVITFVNGITRIIEINNLSYPTLYIFVIPAKAVVRRIGVKLARRSGMTTVFALA
jgi:hypothetical protein